MSIADLFTTSLDIILCARLGESTNYVTYSQLIENI